MGRTLVASSGGVLADRLGWAPFFLLTTVVTVPALLLLIWISQRDPDQFEERLASTASS
jgi:PAT family beta-lactamase induction signal transducer AmpG